MPQTFRFIPDQTPEQQQRFRFVPDPTPAAAPIGIDFSGVSDEELAAFGTSREALTNEILSQQPPAQGTTIPGAPSVQFEVEPGTPVPPLQEPEPQVQIPVQQRFRFVPDEQPIPEFQPEGVTTPRQLLDVGAAAVQGFGQLGADIANINDFVFGTEFEPKVQNFLQTLAPVSEEGTGTEVGRALGQMGGFMAGGGLAGIAGKLFGLGPAGAALVERAGMAGLGMTSGVSQSISAIEEAPEATDMQKALMIASGAGLGALDAFPIERVMKRFRGVGLDAQVPQMVSNLLGERTATGIVSGLRGGLEEGFQEVAQTLGEDAAAKFILGLERDFAEDAKQAGKIGAIAGGIMSFFAGKRGWMKRQGFTDNDIQTLRDEVVVQANEENRRTFEEVQRALISPEIGEFSENLAKLVTQPPVQNGKVAELADQLVTDEGQTLAEVRNNDILWVTAKVASPEFGLRNDPDRQAVAGELIEGQLNQRFYSDLGYAAVDRISQNLSRADRPKVRKAMEMLAEASGPKRDRFEKLLETMSPKVSTAMRQVQTEFENYRTRVVNHKVQVLKEYLPRDERVAVERVLAGESINSAIRGTQTNVEDVQGILREIAEVQSWGIEDFITNIERGTYKLVRKGEDAEGKEFEQVVAVGVTKGDAKRKGLQYLSENPDVDALYIDNRPRRIDPATTRLSPKQARILERQIAERYNEEIDEIAEVTQEDLDRFGLKETPESVRDKLRGLVTASTGRKPRAGTLQKRKGVLEGEVDIFDALPTYIHQVERVLNTEIPVIRAQRFLANNPDVIGETANKNNVLREQVEYVLGKQQESDRILDGIAEVTNDITTRLGLPEVLRRVTGLESAPGRASRTINRARQLEAHLKLGYRPTAAFVNLASGIQHVWVKTGAKYMNEGRKLFRTEEGKKILREEAPYLGIDSSVDFKGGLQAGTAGPERLVKPLGLFQEAEIFPREIGYLANYQMAKDRGLDEHAAREEARRAIRTQLFVYNAAALPHVLRTNSGRLAGQFKTYFVKEAEFIAGLSKPELARYMVSTMALGGPKALVRTLQSIPVIATLVGLGEDQIESFFNAQPEGAGTQLAHNLLTSGLPGAIGFDISAQFAPQVMSPQLQQMAGPAISDAINLQKFLVSPLIRGNLAEATLGTEQFAQRSAIALYNWGKFWDSFHHDGWLHDEAGRRLYKVEDNWDRAQLLLGGTPLDISRAQGRTRQVTEQALNDQKERTAARKYLQRALILGDKDISDDLLDQFMMQRFIDRGGTGEGLRQGIVGALTPIEIRTLNQIPNAKKPDALRRLLLQPRREGVTTPRR